MNPHPEVLAELCRQYRQGTQADILACWQNAHRYWIGINPAILANEPAELTAARTLFVHWQYERNAEDRANYSFCMFALVEPYMLARR